MGRPPKKIVDGTPLTVRMGPRLRPYLEKLTKTDMHGETPSEVVRTLVWDQIKLLIRDGLLTWEEIDEADKA